MIWSRLYSLAIFETGSKCYFHDLDLFIQLVIISGNIAENRGVSVSTKGQSSASDILFCKQMPITESENGWATHESSTLSTYSWDWQSHLDVPLCSFPSHFQPADSSSQNSKGNNSIRTWVKFRPCLHYKARSICLVTINVSP